MIIIVYTTPGRFDVLSNHSQIYHVWQQVSYTARNKAYSGINDGETIKEDVIVEL